ncbi:MAG: hypothetical protein WCU88_03935 [Elusimicrobiota bacterium]
MKVKYPARGSAHKLLQDWRMLILKKRVPFFFLCLALWTTPVAICLADAGGNGYGSTLTASPCDKGLCFTNEEGRVVFWTEYVARLNEAVSGFHRIAEAKEAYAKWTDFLRPNRVATPMTTQLFGKELKTDTIYIESADFANGVDYEETSQRYIPTRIPDRIDQGGYLTLETLYIPYYVDAAYLNTLWSQWLLDAETPRNPLIRDLGLLYDESHDMGSVVAKVENDLSMWNGMPPELRSRLEALITTRSLLNKYGHILQPLFGWINLDPDKVLSPTHIEIDRLPNELLINLAAVQNEIESNLGNVRRHTNKSPKNTYVELPLKFPTELGSGFLQDIIHFPVADVKMGKMSLRRQTQSGKAGPCPDGEGERCYYDENGELAYWASLLHIVKATYEDSFWWGPQKTVESYDTVITGSPAIREQQRQFNKWRREEVSSWDTDKVSYPKFLREQGHLNIDTLLIPVYMADYELKQQREKCFYINDPALTQKCESNFSPAWVAVKEYKDKVLSLEPLTKKWEDIQTEPEYDLEKGHLEPTQLPEGFMSQLREIRQRLDAAVSKAKMLAPAR